MNGQMGRTSKNYGIEDLISIIYDLTGNGRGILDNTVFGKPQAAYEYDALAESQRKLMYDAVRSYRSQMSGQAQQARIRSLAGYTGLGAAAEKTLGFLMSNQLTEGIGQHVVGHYGSRQAVETLLGFANPMARARGQDVGGMTSQWQYQQNMKAAAIEGGMAYNALFNADGSINTSQTHGLGLQAAGYVAGRVLSDRSVRDAWAKSAMSQQSDGGLTKTEIDNLKNGTAWSDAALKSFGEYTKKFTSEINGFVASVSKMTGSYDEAIDFLQKMTGGELFKDTERARRSRDRASVLATNMRLAAADAGISASELYTLTDVFGTSAATAAGLSSGDMSRGGKDAFSRIGGIGAIVHAKWRQMNPKASQEAIARNQLAFGDAINAYIGSDQDKMNALAAKLKGSGMDMADYDRYLKAGNANMSREALIRLVGRDAFYDYMSKPGLAAIDRDAYRAEYEDYSSTSIAYGRSRDAQRAGRYKRFRNAISTFASAMSGGDAGKAQKMLRDLTDRYRDSLLSDEALSSAGISGEEQRRKFREDFKDKDVYTINKELNSRFGSLSGDEANRVAMREIGKYVSVMGSRNVMSKEEEAAAVERLLNDKSLGLTKSQADEFRSRARGKTLSEAEDELRKYLGNERASDLVRRATGGKVSARMAGMTSGTRDIIDKIAPDISEEDIRNAKIDLFMESEAGVGRERFSVEGDDAALASIRREDAIARALEAKSAENLREQATTSAYSGDLRNVHSVIMQRSKGGVSALTIRDAARQSYDAAVMDQISAADAEQAAENNRVFGVEFKNQAEKLSDAMKGIKGSDSAKSVVDLEKSIREELKKKLGLSKESSAEEFSKALESDKAHAAVLAMLDGNEQAKKLVDAGFSKKGIADTVRLVGMSAAGNAEGTNLSEVAASGLIADKMRPAYEKGTTFGGQPGTSGDGSTGLGEVVRAINEILTLLKRGGIGTIGNKLN